MVADKKHNPKREPVWTGLVFDQAAKLWMISYVTPIDIESKHIGNLAHDIFLNELLDRTINVHIEGAYNMIFREDGHLIAHPEYIDKIIAANGNLHISNSNDQHLLNIFQLIKNRQSNTTVIENTKNNEFLAVTKINGPDWYLVTVYPKSLMQGLAFKTASVILFLGIISLLIEITVLFLVLRKQVAQPLQEFLGATKQITSKNFSIDATRNLPLDRHDEIGELAKSFNSMAAQLKSFFDSLDAKVADRTAQLNNKVEELSKTRHELVQSEKMASLGRLVAGFAHELNTPIGVAVGTASVLQNKTKLINKLLEQEEVDEEELLTVLAAVDEASELTLSNLKRASHLVNSFKRTDIKIQLDCPDKLNIYSIPGSLEQILTNLIMNSWIHGFDEGKNSGNIAIAIQLVEDRLKINYSDTGKGIPPEALEKVFEPFFTTNRVGGGSGLGMYICYNIVTTKLAGSMTCESTVGEGVLFKIDFPEHDLPI
ncbi:MAG: HAMP domain-containing protein [Proteobacteria bacterium]|nr:HAMP domain-containing protein [Pseudomonadota bacterium]